MRDSYDMKGSTWGMKPRWNAVAIAGFPGYPNSLRNNHSGLRCAIS